MENKNSLVNIRFVART